MSVESLGLDCLSLDQPFDCVLKDARLVKDVQRRTWSSRSNFPLSFFSFRECRTSKCRNRISFAVRIFVATNRSRERIKFGQKGRETSITCVWKLRTSSRSRLRVPFKNFVSRFLIVLDKRHYSGTLVACRWSRSSALYPHLPLRVLCLTRLH